ncbi:efflux RND transporter periplasmic adaptor subunit [Aeoliella mucimassa]|uniref:Cobalt-zinc-cadmium resistance protein CzcB n=1 Tax=Aeoliella mucimassa TaxID=2527972 RepID=A0A518AQL9_9BACT|nr:efflux RND transporter periplasmic adaptor subunit [Aeoliella mucimassa]QDU57007.1 Cobalt-zinc-cadmium resistance protein CzcB [Aeoliella mucimassa]
MKKFWILTGAACVVAALIYLYAFHWREPAGLDDSNHNLAELSQPTGLHLHAAERQAAGIELRPLEHRELQTTRTLPGRLVYDANKHVAVVAAAAGVIESVLVQPGASVQVGQPIAFVRCPAIGSARSELLMRLSQLELVQREFEWKARVAEGTEKLLALVDERTPVEQIKGQLTDHLVGDNRATLLNAYSRMLLAEQLAQSAMDAGGAAVLTGRVVSERRAEAEQSVAALEAAAEQAKFEAQLARDVAKSELDEAQRQVEVARNELKTLLGLPAAGTAEIDLVPSTEDITLLEVKSPIDGTIERRQFSATERVATGEELFVIADTTKLWVEADIRGGDWGALVVSEGDPVWVTTPATGETHWEAHVVYIGREVDPTSGAAPLVAAIENPEGKLRPGLFARIEAPTSPKVEALVAPSEAVVDMDGQPTVFVPAGDEFKPVGVTIGRRFDNLVEIVSPLSAGDEIVASGAFFLKSELLLAGEE